MKFVFLLDLFQVSPGEALGLASGDESLQARGPGAPAFSFAGSAARRCAAAHLKRSSRLIRLLEPRHDRANHSFLLEL